MHAELHFVLEDILSACQTMNVFGEQAAKRLTTGLPPMLSEQERAELSEAFEMMRLALDRVQPLVGVPFGEMHNWTVQDKDYPFP